ncbi:hypothetical protein [Butyrivibrio sp. XB500-5]|uniref:hypothetical protein n=1 Tax=Butyrivibrio sp. XB500-5 TaxID=2364880 RepID=UPI0011C215BD|nr:hypothetical protein [Butyrivibrio sp. XB500-5]
MDRKTLNRSKIAEIIYLVYIAVMVAARAAGLYEGQMLYNVALVAGLVLFVCKIIMTEHSIKEYIAMVVLMLVAGLVYMFSGEKGLIVCFSMMLGMKAVSIKKVFITSSLVAGVIVIAKIFLGTFGLTGEVYFPIERAGVGLMLRHALGYAHPNTLQMNVLILTMLIMYLFTSAQRYAEKAGKITKRESNLGIILVSVVAFSFNLFIHEYSGSRTGVLACLVFMLFNIWLHLAGKARLFEKVVLYAEYPFVCFIAIGLPFILKGGLFEKVDSAVFQTRLSLARGFWECNSLTLFGQRLVRPSDWEVPYGIDMGQLYLLLQLGIVAFVVMTVMTMFFVHRAIRSNMLPELAFFTGMMVIDIWEPLMYNLSFKNFLFVFFGKMLYELLRDSKDSADSEDVYKNCITVDMVKRGAVAVLVGALLGICSTGLYHFIVPKPGALYGVREQDVYSAEYIEDTLYLSESEIAGIRDSGDIVMDYIDEKTPVYRYGENIAIDEYNRRAMNVGVWMALVVISSVGLPYCFKTGRNRD